MGTGPTAAGSGAAVASASPPAQAPPAPGGPAPAGRQPHRGRVPRAAPRGAVARPGGCLPPSASGSGKRYYAFLPQHGGPAVVAGHELALHELDGSWVGHGRIPCGFESLEEALNHLAQECPGWSIDTPDVSGRLAAEGTFSFPIRFR